MLDFNDHMSSTLTIIQRRPHISTLRGSNWPLFGQNRPFWSKKFWLKVPNLTLLELRYRIYITGFVIFSAKLARKHAFSAKLAGLHVTQKHEKSGLGDRKNWKNICFDKKWLFICSLYNFSIFSQKSSVICFLATFSLKITNPLR